MRLNSGPAILIVTSLLISIAGSIGCFARQAPPGPAARPTPSEPSPVASPSATPPPTVTLAPTSTAQATVTVVSPGPTAIVTIPPTPRPVSLPADDAPHPDAPTEWWYYNGRLEASGGRQFGFHFVVFVVRLAGFPPVRIAHFAITDGEKRVYAADQRAELGPGNASPVDGFDFEVRGWRVAGSGGDDRLSAQVGEYTIDLDFASAKRPVLHGGTGSLDVSTAGQTSSYYSRTRMQARGAISTGAETTDVSGLAWFDHQWGNFSAPTIGWDWLAMQLDDGSDVMLYRMRDLSTGDEFSYGTFVDLEGKASELVRGDFEISSLDTWTSPVTGTKYPSGWAVEVPSRGIKLEARPLVEASEFDARVTTRNVYWEGLVRLTGSHSGWGFVELVGYGTPPTAPR